MTLGRNFKFKLEIWPFQKVHSFQQLILTNGSYSYEMWEELPDDLKM